MTPPDAERPAQVRPDAPHDAERLGLLEEVFRRAPTFLHVLRGPDFVFELANPAYDQLVGHRDLIGRPAFAVMPEAAAGGFPARIARVMATGEPFVGRELPVTLARTPGAAPEERLIDLVYLPLVEPDGTCERVLGHGTDVTDQVRARRQSEAERTASEERLRLAVAATGLGVFDWDLTTDLVTVNARFREIFGLATGDDVIGAAMMGGVVHPEDRAVVEATIAAALDPRSSGAYQFEHRAVTPDGRVVWLLTFGQVFFAGEGDSRRAVRVVGNDLDITERKQAEAEREHAHQQLQEQAAELEMQAEALQAQAAELEEANEALREQGRAAEEARAAAERERARATEANAAKALFLTTMSHELRTPLNAIAGYAELLALGVRGPVTDAQRADLERLQRANQHLIGLVRDVLNFARVDAGRAEYHLEAVRLGPLVADLEALVGPQLAAKGLSYDHDGCGPETPDEPHVVRADAEKVRQILLNLLTNAGKFTDAGGRVAIACDTDAAAGVIRIRVTDTGRGIAPDQLTRIFEPFVQLDRHRTHTSQQGVGLGLAISRDLARGMGGDLTAESIPGVGSTFTLTLPAAVPRLASSPSS